MTKDIIIFLIWLALVVGGIAWKVFGKRRQRVKNEYSEQEHRFFKGTDEFLC